MYSIYEVFAYGSIAEQAKILRREGKILERMDKEDDKGFKTAFFIEWQDNEWLILMHNGEVTRVKKALEKLKNERVKMQNKA